MNTTVTAKPRKSRRRIAALGVTAALVGGIAGASGASAATSGNCYGSYLSGVKYTSCMKAATNVPVGAWAPRNGNGIVSEINTYCYQQGLYGFYKAWDNAKARLGTQLGNSVFNAHSPMC